MPDAPVFALVPLPVALPPERSPVLVYLASLARTGRRTQGSALQVIARRCLGAASALDVPWWLLRYEHVQVLRTWLTEHYAPATATRMLAAVRCVLREAWRLDLLDEHAWHRLAQVPPIRGSRELAGRALGDDEVARLFAACDVARVLGARDAAVLALLFGAGLRRAELAAADLPDYDEAGGSVRVIGKGNKERTCPLPAGARAALARWLVFRGSEPGPLVCPTTKNRVYLRRLSVEGITAALRRCAGRAGVGHFSPHDLRRSYGTDLLDAGVDLGTVQDMMGHASPVTTRRYDRRGARARDAAATRLLVPFVGPVDKPEAPL